MEYQMFAKCFQRQISIEGAKRNRSPERGRGGRKLSSFTTSGTYARTWMVQAPEDPILVQSEISCHVRRRIQAQRADAR